MLDCPDAPLPAAPATQAAAPQTPWAARPARLAKFEREQLFVDYLNRGVGVAEIAMRMGLSEKRMRAVVREILARRAPSAPAEFAAIQVNRLHEALAVAYSAMSGANLRAVDRVVKIVRELDRYHGFAAAALRLAEPSHQPLVLRSDGEVGASRSTLQSPPLAPLAGWSFETPSVRAPQDEVVGYGASVGEAAQQFDRPEIQPQPIENMDSAPGNIQPAEPTAASRATTPPLTLTSEAEGGASRSTPQRVPSAPLPESSFETPSVRAPQDEATGWLAFARQAARQFARPEIPPQSIGNIDSALDNFWPAEQAAAPGGPPAFRPPAHKRNTDRAMLAGFTAC